MPRREVAPKTQHEYERALKRAFGSPSGFGDFDAARVHAIPAARWEHLGEPSRAMLRAALKWSDPEHGARLAESIPIAHRTRRRVKYPTSEEIATFEKGLDALPVGEALILRLMLKLGTRTEEMLLLSREQVESAAKTGKLTFIRKGDVEHELPSKHIAKELRSLLRVEATTAGVPFPWRFVYQLISTNPGAAHRRLSRIIKRQAEALRLPSNWRPHMLRHAFATELIRDGATLPVVQRALGHSSYQTTIKNYVHVDTADLEKWLKEE